jgi:hypothetical protein
MKYIKLFESEIPKFNKYLVFKFKTNLIIAQFNKFIESFPNDIISVKRLYNVREDGDISETEKNIVDSPYSADIKDRIIYQSNDLEHVLDIAPTLFYSSKYNL